LDVSVWNLHAGMGASAAKLGSKITLSSPVERSETSVYALVISGGSHEITKRKIPE
jgi:hypothetical protein